MTIGQLSHAIGRPTGWWRRLDWLLKPIRAADGQRLYHCERALIFIGGYYGPEGWNAAYDAYERRSQARRAARSRRGNSHEAMRAR